MSAAGGASFFEERGEANTFPFLLLVFYSHPRPTRGEAGCQGHGNGISTSPTAVRNMYAVSVQWNIYFTLSLRNMYALSVQWNICLCAFWMGTYTFPTLQCIGCGPLCTIYMQHAHCTLSAMEYLPLPLCSAPLHIGCDPPYLLSQEKPGQLGSCVTNWVNHFRLHFSSHQFVISSGTSNKRNSECKGKVTQSKISYHYFSC